MLKKERFVIMNILVVGCGKVGSRLASVLSRQGHDVSIVSNNEEEFDLLSSDFNGFTTHGVPIDQEILKKAGIENCDAVAAVTREDNINIMVSQMAREIFNVPKVLARIYDPRRGDVFSHFGLHTVCPTNLTVSSVCSALTDSLNTKNMNIGAHTVSFYSIEVPKNFIDNKVSEIDFEDNEVIYAIKRNSTDLILVGQKDIVLQKGDILIFSKVVD